MGEVVNYQILQRVVMVRIGKNFTGFAKWAHKLQTERTQIVRVSSDGFFHREKEKCIGV